MHGMLRSVAGFTLCAFALFSYRQQVLAAEPFTPAVQRAIVSAVEKDRKRYGAVTPVPAVLIGVWKNHHAYIRAFGYANLATRTPLSAADHFRIASNTKTFIISVLLQLVDEGKLRLDDPLSRFDLGVTIPNGRNITVREVCQMRSGLFEAYNTPELNDLDPLPPTATFNARELVSWAVKQQPYFPPGAGYRYSNTNYLILGLIIEAVTGHPAGEEIRRRLLVPYGLLQTSYPSTQAMPNPWAHGYGLDRNNRWEDVSGTIPVSLMGPAGDMISDMTDMTRWTKLWVTGKTNGAATQRARLNCIPTGDGNLSFGLGAGCSAGWYGYTGGLPGYNTANYYFPSKDITIVAWVTLQQDRPFPGVANAIFRDVARIFTPLNVPFVKRNAGRVAGR